MSENRRSFLRRGLKVLAVAVPVAAVVASAPKSAEARALLRGRFRRTSSGCKTCG